jgi:O-antigen ligase
MFEIGVLLSVLLVPMFFMPWVDDLKDIVGFNLIYWVVLLTFFGFLLKTARTFKQLNSLPLPKELIFLLLIPYVLAHLHGYAYIHFIPPELIWADSLARVSIGPVPWYTSHLLGSLLVVAVALMVSEGLVAGMMPQRILLFSCFPIWIIVPDLVYITITSQLGLTGFIEEENRAFLQFSGFGIHGNALGTMLVPLYALLLGIILSTKESATRYFLIATFFLSIIGILFSFSRTAYFSSGLVTFLFMKKRGVANQWLIIGVVVIILAVVLPGIFLDRALTGTSEGDIDLMLAGRLRGIWLPLIEDIFDAPILGHGIRSILWSKAMATGSMFTVSYAHNAYLELLLDMGLIGLLLVLGFYRYLFKLTKAIYLKANEPIARGLASGASLAALSMIFLGFTGDQLTPELHHIYFWISIGFVLGLKRLSRYA